jgi:hypothetical protein
MANELRSIAQQPPIELLKQDASVRFLARLASAVEVSHNFVPQFPEDLIPAIQADVTASPSLEFANLASSELATGLSANLISATAVEDPPIVVTGPHLPKPIPVPDDAEIRLQKVRREVARLEITYHVLSLIDGIATINCVSRRTCKELNPLMGSRPSALRVIGVKAITGLLVHRSLNRMVEKNPYQARSVMRISVALQAAITGFTMRASF